MEQHIKEWRIEENAYEDLFASERLVEIPDLSFLSWYPNRDSLSYTYL